MKRILLLVILFIFTLTQLPVQAEEVSDEVKAIQQMIKEFLFLLPDPKPETLEPSPTVSGKSL